MLTIRTVVRPSAIHGNGVFADETVLPGETVWQFEPTFDRVIREEDLASIPQTFRDFLDIYAYRSTDLDGALVLSCDNARYLNHSANPNTCELPFRSVASRIIQIGDEITCDYGRFCTDDIGFTVSAADLTNDVVNAGPPHQNLYTRIKPCRKGVGVFAIRDIPMGVDLFAGDTGQVVNVPVSQVHELEDEEIRRIYLDFCPVVDGFFIAPQDFNQMTIGWYLNHSDSPNVAALPGLQFVTSRRVRQGEELTTDYSTYSDHAKRFVDDWA